jgi:hypothetical protein
VEEEVEDKESVEEESGIPVNQGPPGVPTRYLPSKFRHRNLSLPPGPISDP